MTQALFSGTVTYSNTRPQQLINGGTFVMAHSLHRLMQSVHPSLTIGQWLNEIKGSSGKGTKSKRLIRRVREQLRVIANTSTVGPNTASDASSVTPPFVTQPVQPRLVVPSVFPSIQPIPTIRPPILKDTSSVLPTTNTAYQPHRGSFVPHSITSYVHML